MLKRKLIIRFFFLLCVVFTLVAGCELFFIQKPLTSELSDARRDLLRLISQRVDTCRNNLVKIANLYTADGTLYNMISLDKDSMESVSHTAYQAFSNHMDTLNNTISQTFEGINYYVSVIAENGFQYSSQAYIKLRKLRTVSWHMRNIVNHDDSYFVTNYNDFYSDGTENYVLGAVRVLRNRDDEYIGTIMVCMPETDFFNIYSDIIDEKTSIFILDELSRVVSHKDKQYIGQSVFPIQDYSFLFDERISATINRNGMALLTKYINEESGWTVVEEISYSSIMTPLTEVLTMTLILCIMAYIIAFVFSVFLAQYVARPISDFCNHISKASENGLQQIPISSTYREIAILGEEYNNMLGQVKALMQETREKETLRRKTEIAFLRAQITPHFLYNTLFAVQCTIEMGKYEDATRMIKLLIPILREMTGREDETCMIVEEINLQTQYIELLHLRYNDEIEMKIDISDELMEARIIRGIIQPIIENAVFHGLEPQGGGRIILSIREKDDVLQIDVADNGIGMREDVFREALTCDSKDRRSNIGLYNVNARIQYHYGNGFGLEYVVRQAGEYGTCIRIKLPLITK